MELRRIGSALAGGFAAEAVSKLVPLVILHVVVTRIGAEAFGRAQFAYWLVDMAIAFVVFGYTNVGAVDIAKAQGEATKVSTIVSEILTLKLIHSVVAVAGLLAFVRVLPTYAPYEEIVTALAFLLVTSALDMSYVHIGGARMLSLSAINIVVKLASLFAVVAWVREPSDALTFALINFGANGVVAVANFFLNLPRLTLRVPNGAALRSRFRASLPFAVTVFLMLALERYDVFVAEHLLGPLGAGLYGAPVRIVQALVHVVAAIGMVYFGEVAAKGDAASLTRLLNQGIWVTFALLMPIAVGVWFVGEPLLILVAGEEYRHLTGVFGLLVLTLIGQSLIVAYGTQVLMVQGRGLLLNGALFGATLLGLALAPPLSKEFGMFGIAAVTLLTRTLAGVALAVGARRHVERYPWRECASTVLPALGMAAVLAALSNGNLWHDLALGAGAYALLFLATNVQAVRRLWPR